MPEYLAPGVYVEETSFRQKSIEGVSTSTAGFIGPTRFGPTEGEPELLTSFFDFERIYGGIDQLEFEGGSPSHNDVAHAVRAFYENGGRRLYVTRTYDEGKDDGVATCKHGDLTLEARWPGAAGDFRVTFAIDLSDDIIVPSDGVLPTELKGAQRYDTVLVSAESGASSPGIPPGLYFLDRGVDRGRGIDTWSLKKTTSEANPPLISVAGTGIEVRVVIVSVSITPMGHFMDPRTWDELAPHPQHHNSLAKVFEPTATARRSTELFMPLIIGDADEKTGVQIVTSLLSKSTWAFDSLPSDSFVAEIGDELSMLEAGVSTADNAATLLELWFVSGPETVGIDKLKGFKDVGEPLEVTCQLDGGSDGDRPKPAAYEGDESNDGKKSGLKAFEDLEDISIVAAPGSTCDSLPKPASTDSATIQQLLIGHTERMRYRIAVLDSPNGAILGQIRKYRGKMDSKYAAVYYPWVKISDPVTETEIIVPPSGFMAGIYARNDIERGVHKAPANEVVRLAVGFEYMLNKAQQEVLNPRGVNCLRFFEGRGYRVWGARTITSDPEWKYVNLRRYFAFLEHSIDRGTQWAVFEPNGSALWANVRRTIEDFLFNEWKSRHLMGDSPEEAYFVKCDRSTMTQNDIDNGRLICLIGVTPLRPAEFVIFRIGQKTLPGLGGS